MVAPPDALQVPPGVVGVRLIEDPWQTAVGPDIKPGIGLTVNTAVEAQPEPAEKDKVVVPGAIALTKPPLVTEAVPGELLDQVPIPEPHVTTRVPAGHALRVPVMIPGEEFTVTMYVDAHPAGIV